MRLTLPLLLALCALAAHADDPKTWDNSDVWNRFEDKFDDSAKWQEVRQQLPAYPKPEHFIPIVLGARSSNHFYVDYPSVSVGTDGVVRYSMVVESPSGARTVNFEGIRCATGERKLYAFGHDDGHGGGTWSRNRYARWDAITVRSGNDYRNELYNHYFCALDAAASLADIQQSLKSGGHYD